MLERPSGKTLGNIEREKGHPALPELFQPLAIYVIPVEARRCLYGARKRLK